jgi:hypothetical protein
MIIAGVGFGLRGGMAEHRDGTGVAHEDGYPIAL